MNVQEPYSGVGGDDGTRGNLVVNYEYLGGDNIVGIGFCIYEATFRTFRIKVFWFLVSGFHESTYLFKCNILKTVYI